VKDHLKWIRAEDVRVASLLSRSMMCKGALLIALCFPGASVLPAAAQNFPARPVRLIVPVAAGSSTDVLARLLGQKLNERWRQPVVVEDRPGGGGTLGTEIAARASPDGYTILMVNAGFVVSAALYKNLAYDSIRDFAPIGLVATQPMVLVVNPSLPTKSVKELVSLAKGKPDQITFGSTGNGSIAHLVAEMFKSKAGIRMLHVPYKGAGPAVTALVAGEIQVLFPGIVPALPHIKSGRLRALAVSTAKRAIVVPDIPTMIESGVIGYDESNWQGFLAPTGTPQEIIAKFSTEVSDIVQSPEIRRSLAAEGTEPLSSDPPAFGKFLAEEIAKWRKLVRETGARIE
jgi:tripartite-type tricarboxylate transporter receptor subunit TctC